MGACHCAQAHLLVRKARVSHELSHKMARIVGAHVEPNEAIGRVTELLLEKIPIQRKKRHPAHSVQ